MKDKKRIILTCSECLSRNYSTNKNRTGAKERLELMKYCPKCNKHTLHKETK
ncbi:MAG: 50S ribosomal protein L33 [Erysipelotrichaceae bacterium]|nr:50S ribosomal protein L33 [Erysipelotrichaceae bacterium]